MNMNSVFTVTINDQPVVLPVVALTNAQGVRRDVVSQTDLLLAVAEHRQLDLATEAGAMAAYDLEEELARRYCLTDVVQLRPPLVPLTRAGSYRGVPVKLDETLLNEAANAIVDKLLQPDGRIDWLSYLHYNTVRSYAPTVQLTHVFFAHMSQSLCEQWSVPQSAAEDVAAALKRALVAVGMAVSGLTGSPGATEIVNGTLELPLPFNEEAGVERLRYELSHLGDSEMDLWRLIDAYLEAGFGVDQPWRGIYTAYEALDAPEWPLLDAARLIMGHGDYTIRIPGSDEDSDKILTEDEVEPKLRLAAEGQRPVAETWRYFVLYGQVRKKPFEFPDVESIRETLAAVQRAADYNKEQGYILEEELAARLTERYGRIVTPRDIQDGLAEPRSFVNRAFARACFNTHRTYLSRHQTKDTDFSNYGYERKVLVGRFSDRGCQTRMGDDSASNLPVHVLELLANSNNSVLMMTVFGPRESVTAAFARLFTGSSRKKYATTFSVGNFGSLYPLDRTAYDHMRQRVPDTKNSWAMTLLSHQAIPDKFDTENHLFYVLVPEEWRACTPPHFLGMLDRAIPLPLLPSWAGYLWLEGIDRGLITPIGKQIGTMAGWEVGTASKLSKHTDRTWQAIIQDGFKERIISIKSEPDIKVEELAPDNVQVEILPQTYVGAVLDMAREARSALRDEALLVAGD